MRYLITIILISGCLSTVTTTTENSTTSTLLTTTTIEAFCGSSTYNACSDDGGCKTAGCSGQICTDIGDDRSTTCEWRDCYDETKYGLICKCIDNKCQWA